MPAKPSDTNWRAALIRLIDRSWLALAALLLPIVAIAFLSGVIWSRFEEPPDHFVRS